MSSRDPLAFTCFIPLDGAEPAAPTDARLTRYRVDDIKPVRGEAISAPVCGGELLRVERRGQLAAASAPFIGVTQHLVYTAAQERLELTRVSASESGPVAVLIPICKAQAWWALAQDERRSFLRAGGPGHFEIGLEYASTIYRRLYHARALPGSAWDFLTYFEFPRDRSDDFRALLQRLRDTDQNPEWQFVEREVEIWMSKSP
jgi:hypothetical protein